MLDDTTGSTRFAALDRRTLLRAGAWAAPVLVVAAAVPAASASPISPGLERQGSITAQGIGVQVRAYALGGAFLPGCYIELIITSTGDVLNPAASPSAGWEFTSASNETIVARYLTEVSGNGFNATYFQHAFTETAGPASVSLSGHITGTSVNEFVGGPLVGPQ